MLLRLLSGAQVEGITVDNRLAMQRLLKNMIRQFPLLAPALLFAFFLSETLHAGASNKNGNPFGNGTFFDNTGTFSAVIRGENLSGTILFSTGAGTNGLSGNSSGSCLISYLGTPDGAVAPGVYRGNAVGMWDPSSGSISGQFWGGYTLSGKGNTTIYPEIYNPDFPVAINISNSVTGETNPSVFVEPIGNNNYNDSVYMNGSFEGSVQNKYPNQTFSAPGTIAIQQLYPQQQGDFADPKDTEGTVPVQTAYLNIPVTVQGLRISDRYSSFSTINNDIPYSFTTYEIKRFPGGL